MLKTTEVVTKEVSNDTFTYDVQVIPCRLQKAWRGILSFCKSVLIFPAFNDLSQ